MAKSSPRLAHPAPAETLSLEDPDLTMSGSRSEVARQASCQIEALLEALETLSEAEACVRAPLIDRVRSLNSCIMSIHSGDDGRATEEMEVVVFGKRQEAEA